MASERCDPPQLLRRHRRRACGRHEQQFPPQRLSRRSDSRSASGGRWGELRPWSGKPARALLRRSIATLTLANRVDHQPVGCMNEVHDVSGCTHAAIEASVDRGTQFEHRCTVQRRAAARPAVFCSLVIAMTSNATARKPSPRCTVKRWQVAGDPSAVPAMPRTDTTPPS